MSETLEDKKSAGSEELTADEWEGAEPRTSDPTAVPSDCTCAQLNGPTLGLERHQLLTAAGLDCRDLFDAGNEHSSSARLRDELARVLPRALAALGREVLRFRERAQLSQQELASHMQVSVEVVQQVESGHGTYDDASLLLLGLGDLLAT